MRGRIVEITAESAYISVWRGFMVVDKRGVEAGRVPLDDITAVITQAHGLTYSNNFLVALAKRGIPFVLSGDNYQPVGVLMPLVGHSLQAQRIEAQTTSKLPLRKRLWADLIKAKVDNQIAVLQRYRKASQLLAPLPAQIRSGDPDNIEAQAARKYWTALFSAEFRRDQQAPGINTLLNYGYTVLRSTMAKATIASGLHPSIGLHHSNDLNPFRLIDDLVEPFRPMVDSGVYQLTELGHYDLDKDTKSQLVKIMTSAVSVDNQTISLELACQQLASSLAHIFLLQEKKLKLPKLCQPTSATLDIEE